MKLVQKLFIRIHQEKTITLLTKYSIEYYYFQL